jgi:uncharacterized membrane protein
MEPLFTVWLVIILILGIAMLICDVLMFKNRKVAVRKLFFTTFSRFKPELYNERGNRFRKIWIVLYIVGIIFAFGMLIFMSYNYNF